ncbi:MAG: hypothetical protein WA191_00915 [Telluria sp.]
MKSKFKFATWFAAILATMAMAGCATSQDAEHSQHHPDTSTAQPMGMMGGAPGGQMAMTDMKDMDMKSMCEMHKKMMSAKTPEEQKAMMDERMKSMSPEMMKKHMTMMQECK